MTAKASNAAPAFRTTRRVLLFVFMVAPSDCTIPARLHLPESTSQTKLSQNPQAPGSHAPYVNLDRSRAAQPAWNDSHMSPKKCTTCALEVKHKKNNMKQE